MHVVGRTFPQGLLGAAFFAMLLVPPSAAQSVRRGPIKLEELSRQEFEKLPPDQLLTLQGRSLTKSEFLAEFQQKRSRSFRRRGTALDLASRMKQFQDKERNRIEMESASRLQAHKGLHEVGAGAVAVHCLVPKIEGFEVDVVEPGMHYLTITGCGFGCAKGAPCSGVEGPGEVRLYGNFPGGFAHLPISPYQWWPVWYDGKIDVNVPQLGGVHDHPVQLQVVRKDGKQSNLWPLKLKAARVMKRLDFSDFQVTCSNAGTTNTCGPGKTAQHDPDETKTATVYHGKEQWLALGTDTFSLSLKNGWYFDSYDFQSSGPTLSGVTPPEFTPSPNTVFANLPYAWVVYDGTVRYDLTFTIVGPQGLDYK